jgi:hypothetical protein
MAVTFRGIRGAQVGAAKISLINKNVLGSILLFWYLVKGKVYFLAKVREIIGIIFP